MSIARIQQVRRSQQKRLSANLLYLKKIRKEISCRLLQNQAIKDRTQALLKDLEMTYCCKFTNLFIFKWNYIKNFFLFSVDYVAWNGANPDIISGCKIKANGPNQFLRSERTYTPRGASSNLCKGPQSGLAMGSIYAQTNRQANVACN